MPTTWTERTATGPIFQEGRATGTGEDDFYIDVLFEATGFFGIVPTPHTERSVTASIGTEKTAASTSWTERTV